MRREKLKDIADSLTRPRTRPRATPPSQHPPPTRDRDAEPDVDPDQGKLKPDDSAQETPVSKMTEHCGSFYHPLYQGRMDKT